MIDVLDDAVADFHHAVMQGLSQDMKSLPARFFYDLRGSELFEQITQLPEYYPTRTETGLLRTHATRIADLTGRGKPIVEFGAGSAIKTPLLIKATSASVYVPIDISGEFLAQSAAALASANEWLDVLPVVGDFTRPLLLPKLEGPVTGFFPGSTIGNFDEASSIDLLRSFRQTLGQDAHLVIGIDLRKSRQVLEAAYADAAGITAAFNLNLLHRINRELDGNIPVEAFKHRAIWNETRSRIEMHVVATRDVNFRAAGRGFSMKEDETIHTENSYKYTRESAQELARCAGWEPVAFWTDPDQLFGLHVWSAMQGSSLQ